MSDGTQHIPFEQLVDLVEERLPRHGVADARAHLATCPRCGDDVAWLNQTVALMRSDDLEEAPAHVVARAVRLLRPVAPSHSPTLKERVRAALSFDSRQSAPAFGLRSGQAETRQLLFSAGAYDLDIRVAPAGALWIVSGQVLGLPASGRIELRGEQSVMEVDLTALSEFVLPAAPEGSYLLLLHLENGEIEIGELELRR